MQKSGITVLVIMSLLMLVIFVSGCTSSNNSISNENKTFENDVIKFNYPSNFDVKDASNGTYLDIYFYNGTTNNTYNEVGEVVSGRMNESSLRKTYSGWNNTTICGYRAIRGKDKMDAGAILFISDGVGLSLTFDPAYENAANRIINSLVIKQVPTIRSGYDPE